MGSLKDKAINGFVWRFLQNISAKVVTFVIQIILARILMPEDYGIIAMVTVFTNIAMVFINTGFSSAVVQKKEISEIQLNTMFYSGLVIGAILYIGLYFGAPWIAAFYDEPLLVDIVRAEALIVLFGSTSSIHQALMTRDMLFQKGFVINLAAAILQGIVGLTLALTGFGVWALVYSTLAYYLLTSVFLWIFIRWVPKWQFSFSALFSLLSFSLKMLLAGLIDAIFNNIRSLIIGKQYTKEDLAYYNKGYQFPSLIMIQVDGAITNVLFTTLSKFQDDWKAGASVLRRSIKTSLYVCFPLMAGLIAVARSMVLVLLTDKWQGAIIYVQLTAVLCAFWPLSAKRHALNARGKSGVSLVLNIIGKVIALVAILITYKHSVQLMVISTVAASILSNLIGLPIYAKTIEYRMIDQLKDICPPLLLSAAMGGIVWSVQLLSLNLFVTLVLQILVGIVVYVGGSVLFRMDSFYYCSNILKGFLGKLKRKTAVTDPRTKDEENHD